MRHNNTLISTRLIVPHARAREKGAEIWRQHYFLFLGKGQCSMKTLMSSLVPACRWLLIVFFELRHRQRKNKYFSILIKNHHTRCFLTLTLMTNHKSHDSCFSHSHLNPSGVLCQDTVAGAYCGPCPEGYEGDGKKCVQRRNPCHDHPCAAGSQNNI